jgi:hypothetical protein
VLTVAASLLATHVIALSMTCGSELPVNIRAGVFRSEMIRLLDRSETFRTQCSRIAFAPHVRIAVAITRSLPDGSRAQTTIERYEAGAIVARMVLKFGEDYVELIPHEMEHVIEQLDHVRLSSEEAAARAWRPGGGPYETLRAVATGQRARQEFDALVMEAFQADGRKAPGVRHPFD